MARKPALNLAALKELGPEKLARLVLDEAKSNTGFKRKVSAALAARSGPEAVAKLIDRRLDGLERAKSFIDWDRARAFRDDIQSLVDAVMTELGDAAPVLAIDRLLRFLATHEAVFERVDDSSGRVQGVYYRAIEVTGELTQQLPAADAALLPGKIMAALGETTHGYLTDVTDAVAPHLTEETLHRWDSELAEAIEQRKSEEAHRSSEGRFFSMTSQWREMRQTIAAASGDLDLLIALEAQKAPRMQDTLGIAAVLLDAGRMAEALDWVRRNEGDSPRLAISEERASSPARVRLEARILEALEEKGTAQDLRWQGFEATLSADLLRDHLDALPDFDDMEIEERAFLVALEHPDHMTALQFFLDWPRPDLAARLIVERCDQWECGRWDILPKVADDLQHEHPLAATILYRTLLDDIIARARSKAYSHGARYLRRLDLLAPDAEADPAWPKGFDNHATYVAALQKTHGRKTGFWSRVSEKK